MHHLPIGFRDFILQSLHEHSPHPFLPGEGQGHHLNLPQRHLFLQGQNQGHRPNHHHRHSPHRPKGKGQSLRPKPHHHRLIPQQFLQSQGHHPNRHHRPHQNHPHII